MMLTDEQFVRTRRLALSLAGMELHERHRDLIDQRKRRLGLAEPTGYDTLLSAVESGDTAAAQHLISLLATHFTGFFRHPQHFLAAAAHARSAVDRRGVARLWCAAASTGEEPYSLAMALVEARPDAARFATILATDIDHHALARGRDAIYPAAAMAELSPERRTRFFQPALGSDRVQVIAPIRAMVEFAALNLAEVAWPTIGTFDVIFCRNVLMYLEACYRYAVLERMASLLTSEGRLILDPTEHLGKASHLFTVAGPGLYTRRPAPSPQRPLALPGHRSV